MSNPWQKRPRFGRETFTPSQSTHKGTYPTKFFSTLTQEHPQVGTSGSRKTASASVCVRTFAVNS